MTTIWKFPLDAPDAGEVTVTMPIGAKVLTVQNQNDIPCMWAICDSKAPMQERTFWIFPTGSLLSENPGEYIATFQMRGFLNQLFVFHVFETTPL